MLPCLPAPQQRQAKMNRQNAPKILVVDAGAPLRRPLQLALHREGYSVYTVADGHKAVRVLKMTPLDLVLLKVPTLGMDGYALCAALRQASTVPIMVLSSNNDIEDLVQALTAGADDYLCKPFDRLELVVRIHALLRRVAWQTQPEFRQAPMLQAAQPATVQPMGQIGIR